MQLVAHLSDSGKYIYYANGVFYIDGNGPISRRRLARLDRAGGIQWLDEEAEARFNEGDAFDPSSTAHLGEAAPEPAGPRDWVHAGSVFMTFALVAAVIGGAVTGKVAVDRSVETRHARAQQAARATAPIDAMAQLETATERGLTYDDYLDELEMAGDAVTAYKPEDDATAGMLESLELAAWTYDGAADAWATTASEDPQAAFEEFKVANGGLGITSATAEEAVSELWARASGHILEARATLDYYESELGEPVAVPRAQPNELAKNPGEGRSL